MSNRDDWLASAVAAEEHHLELLAALKAEGEPPVSLLLSEMTFYIMVGENRARAPWGNEITDLHKRSADRFATFFDKAVARWMERRQ